jgi:hypothetical protein
MNIIYKTSVAIRISYTISDFISEVLNHSFGISYLYSLTLVFYSFTTILVYYGGS